MLFAIVAAWLAYRKAKETGRNAIKWAFIAVAVFVGTQLIVGLAVGIMLGLGIVLFGWSQEIAEKVYTIPANIIAIFASFGTTWLLLRYLDKIPEEDTFVTPPPPPNF